jgi:hypothetical protein
VAALAENRPQDFKAKRVESSMRGGVVRYILGVFIIALGFFIVSAFGEWYVNWVMDKDKWWGYPSWVAVGVLCAFALILIALIGLSIMKII